MSKRSFVPCLVPIAIAGALLLPSPIALAGEDADLLERLIEGDALEMGRDALDPEIADESDPMAQVNSVSELTDISPTDWAFQAVRSLVERYKCLEGFPDNTFRGDRPLTRYEFAAALNRCLNRVLELVAGNGDDDNGFDDDTFQTITELQEEFRAELAALESRVGNLEDRLASAEAQPVLYDDQAPRRGGFQPRRHLQRR